MRVTTKYPPHKKQNQTNKEKTVKFSKVAKAAVVATVSVALAVPTLTSANAASKFASATSASQVGGLAKLTAECKKEGQLNVIALPHYWANYGDMIEGFKKAYGVKVDEADPEGSSQDEIDAANRLKGTNRSPDVFDIGLAVADKYLGTGTFAPYKVRNWANNLGASAVSSAEYTPNYTGTMTIGYDGSLGTITKLDDLLKPAFKGKVTINGDPQGSSAGLNSIFMVNLALGGTLDDISPAVAWFKKLKQVGNFINVNPTQATIASGQTPVVMDNGYISAGIAKEFAKAGKTWKMFTPASLGSTYNSAVSAWAPHPACARLWMEYTLGETGAGIWAVGGATPTLWIWMVKTGRAPAAGVAAIGKSKVAALKATSDQSTKAREYLKTAWADAVGA
jgi:putative spermidine/putrescine transport system substrate-binding protein